HRIGSNSVFVKDLRYVEELDAVSQSVQPKIPILKTPENSSLVIAAELLPDGATKQRAARYIVPLKKALGVKWPDIPAARAHPEEFPITVNDAYVWTRVQNGN